MKNYSEKEKRSLAVYVFIFLLLVMGIATSGYLSFRNFEGEFRHQAEDQISAIAELKVNELVNWRSERLSDAGFLYHNPAFSALVERYFENPDDVDAQAQLLAWLGNYQAYRQSDRLLLLDATGNERFSFPPESGEVETHLAPDVASSLRSGKVTFLDFHRDTSKGGEIHLAILVPIFADKNNTQPLGVLAFIVNPQTYLYPYIQNWPTPSDSAETILVRRDGEDVLFLNELRFEKNAALNLRYPLTSTDIPAVKAVLGQTGIVEGMDYRGEQVLADVRAVPDSPWFLISKMDTAEVYEPLRARLWQTFSVTGMAILVAGTGLALAWRQQRILFYRSKAEVAEALRESEQMLQNILENFPGVVFWKDTQSNYLGCNWSCAARAGLNSPSEIIGKNDFDMPWKETEAENYQTDDREVMESGKAKLHIVEMQHQFDGRVTWLDTSKIPLRDSKGQVMGVLGVATDITEHKQTEEELGRQTALFRNLFEKSPEAITIVDQNDCILNVNRSFEILFGYSEAEIKGRYVNDLIVSELYRDEAEDITRATLGDGQVLERETVRCTKDGQPVIVSMVGYPIVVDGQVICGSGIYRDITERKRADEKLREAQLVLENSPVILFRWKATAGWPVELVSENIAQFGYTPEEFLSGAVPYASIVHPDDLERVWREVREYSASGVDHFQQEYRIITKDGQIRWTDDQTMIKRDAQGNITHYQGTIMDITDRKLAEEALRAAEEKYRNIFENAMESITQTTPEGKFITANPAAARMEGYDSPEELIADISDLGRQFYVKPGRREEFKKLMEEFGTISGFESEVYRKDGSRIWVLENSRAVFDEQGNVRYYEGTSQDITERKQAEEAIREKELQLRAIGDNLPYAQTYQLMIKPDKTSQFTYVSRQVEHLHECTVEQVLANPNLLFGRVVEEDVEALARATEKSIAEMSVFDHTMRIRRKSGEIRWHRMISKPRMGNNGVIVFDGLDMDITERKQAEEELRAAEAKYRALVEQIPAITYIDQADGSGRSSFISPQIQSILGVSPEDWRQADAAEWGRMIHPEDSPRVLAAYRNVVETGQPFNEEYRIFRPDGRLVWIDDHAIRLDDASGQPSGIHGVMFDITERKRAEDEIKRNANFTNTLLDAIPTPVFYKDHDGKYQGCNRAFTEITGVTSNEMKGKTVYDLWPGELSEVYHRKDVELMNNPRHQSYEFQVKDKDGSLRPVIYAKDVFRDEHGQVAGMVGAFIDITDRKQAETALRESEEKMRSIFRVAPTGIGVIRDRALVEVNPLISEMTGYTKEELTGQSSRILYPTQEEFEWVGREKYKQIAEKGTGVVETHWQKKDGSIIDILLASTPIDLADHSKGVTFTALDITERKRAEEALRESEERLRLAVSAGRMGTWDRNFLSGQLNWSVECKAMFGLVPEVEMNDERFMNTVHPEDRLSTDLAIRKALEKQADFNMEYRAIWPDGTVHWITAQGRGYYNDAGQAIRMTGITFDITDRKRAEEALRDSQQLLQAVMDNIPQCIFWKDSQLNYLGCNRAFADSAGLASPSNIVGKTDFDLPSEYAELYRADDISVMKSGVPKLNYEEPQTTPDGVTTWLRTSKVPMRDVDGNVYAVLGMYEDITERKRVDEALRAAEEKYRNIFENAMEAITQTTPDGKFITANPATARMEGYDSPEELIAESSHLDNMFYVNPSRRDEFKKMMEEYGTISGFESEVYRKDGSRIWIVENSRTVCDEHGNVLYYEGTAQDITERKRAEEALRESEERFRSLYDNATIGLYRTTPGGRILMVNPAGLQMLGYDSFEEISKRNLENEGFEAADSRREFREIIDREGMLIGLESKWTRKDGSQIFVRESAKAFHDENGKILYYDGSFEDVSGRVKAEAALRESEELYRKMNENSPLGMHFYRLDENNQLVFAGANPAADKLLGVDNSQFIGKTIGEAFPALMQTEVSQRYREAAANGTPWSTEQIAYEDRQIRGAFEVKAFQTTPGNMVAVFADITARKKAEEALRESEALYRQAIEVANAVPYRQSYHVDGQTVKYDFVGEGIRQITGYGPEEFDEPLWDSLTEERFLLEELTEYSFDEAIERVRSGIDPVWKCEHRIRARDGSTHWVFEAAVELRDQNGISHGSIGLFQDITARKQAEEEIRQLNLLLEQRVVERTAQLENTNRELEAFSYSVSHDLRAPLRGIDGWSQALLEDYYDRLDEQGQQYIDRVRSETQRMGHLIDDMLQLSRLTRAEMVKEQVDLSALAQTIVEGLKRDEPQRKVIFNIQTGVTAQGDPHLLEAVLSNLLGNAFKFTGKRRNARIEFGSIPHPSLPSPLGRGAGGEGRIFFVRDNGAGFDMAYSQKLFGTFQRMHKVSEFPGTGIGLATVQRVIHRHGGRVWAEAEVERGATFYFTLG